MTTPASAGSEPLHPDQIIPAQLWRGLRLRWWGVIAGLAGGIFDIAALSLAGFTFTINGADGRVLMAAYFGVSFAVLGYLLGSLVETQRRERRTAALLQAQADTIAATRARLAQSEKLAALGQLAATIAHEVRNPLGIMRSAAQTLDETLPAADAAAHRAAGFIIAEIDRLANVVKSILAYARPLQLSSRAVRVGDLVDRVALLADPDLAARGVRLERGAGADLLALVDSDLISQVLLGLLANAAEAMPDGGVVSLAAHTDGDRIALQVADSGPGIDPGLRQQVFDPFFTTRPRGTGLGLAIARQIVEAHGGRIEIDAAPGGGARFTLTLPAAPAAALAA